MSDIEIKKSLDLGCFGLVLELVGIVMLIWIFSNWNQFWNGIGNFMESIFK